MLGEGSKSEACYKDTPNAVPNHVAIIMDGNGRWATSKGLPRSKGHHAGVEAVRRIVRAARDQGVKFLTLYSFSSENWTRPKSEIFELFALLKLYIRRDLADLHKNNVRLKVIGEREGVPDDILPLLDEAQQLTAENSGQTLIIAFNYGSRREIATAFKSIAKEIEAGNLSASQIDEALITDNLDTHGIPDPDLIIRTSGEKRLSNFLMWQAAYSELIFVDCLWPDFSAQDFAAALEEYYGRTRRYGGLKQETAS